MPEEKDSQYSFPKYCRLRKSNEIKSLFNSGKRIESERFILYCKENKLPYPRIAIVTSRRVGKAVFRNKLRRYVREIFRCNKSLFNNKDYVIIFKKNISVINYHLLFKEIEKVTS